MYRAIKTVDEQGREWTTPHPTEEQRASLQASRSPSPVSLAGNKVPGRTSPQPNAPSNPSSPAPAVAPNLSGKDFPPLSPPTAALPLPAPASVHLASGQTESSATTSEPTASATSAGPPLTNPTQLKPARPSKSPGTSTNALSQKARATKQASAKHPSIGRIREILVCPLATAQPTLLTAHSPQATNTLSSAPVAALTAVTPPTIPPEVPSTTQPPPATAPTPQAPAPPPSDATTGGHSRKRRRTDGDIPSPTITLALQRDDNQPASPPPVLAPSIPPLPVPPTSPAPPPPPSPAATAMSIDLPPTQATQMPVPDPSGQENPVAHDADELPPLRRSSPSPEQPVTIAPSFRQHGDSAKIFTSSPWQAWIPLSPSQERGWQHSIGHKKAVFCAEYAQAEPIGVASTDRISADLTIALQRPAENAVQVAYPHPTISPSGAAPARSSVWHFVHDLRASEADALLAACVISRDGRAYIFLPAALNTSQPVFLYALNGLRGPTADLEKHLRRSISSSPVYQDLCTAHHHHPDMPLFLQRIRIDSLPIKDSSGRPTPAYRLYAHLPSDDPNEQQRARDSLRSISFDHHLYGAATQATYKCGHCHGVDHPSGLCPLPSLPGWQGPNPLSRPAEQTLDALPPPVLPEAPSSLMDPPSTGTGRGRGRGRGSRGGRGGRGRGNSRG
ncbi:hypothetical protein K488DRAFT_86653 [Vararia minispora EC-137]|uniref:Uncharacterized protein n=1 Tax=Vararia minispora EC-137 TaxID=1314806 RepID=A0ACB8QIS6_9AGAM|nr:hypothetical protein K488DRAFT_86653 [Vararia minispora EC-137]